MPTGVGGKPYIDLYIINEGDDLIREFIENNPSFKRNNIFVDLMH
jgi:hypothetical protein